MKKLIIFLLYTGLLVIGCKEETEEPVPSSDLYITSLWPSGGTGAMIVTINGKHFDETVEGNSVQFNGVDAIVIEASDRQLQVVAPENGKTGKVTVSAHGQTVEGPVFTYQETPVAEYIVETYAGNGIAGWVNGPVSAAQFRNPEGVAVDAHGNIFVADRQNNLIRRITVDGTVSTYAGDGTAGYVDGPAATAQFNLPWKLAVDAAGNVFVADRNNFKIRKISPDGIVSTLAGSTAGYADGPGSAAQFMQPLDVAVDAEGNVIVADNTGHRIRKVTPAGMVSTLAGDGKAGFADGKGMEAKFRNPSGLTIDADGNIWVADRLNHRIRKITPDGMVSTVAGTGTAGLLDGDASAAKFADPYGIAVDVNGNVLVAELTNARIRKITPEGIVSTLAGSSAGFADGLSTTAKFNQPTDLDIDQAGNIYVAEVTNHRIRKIRLIK